MMLGYVSRRIVKLIYFMLQKNRFILFFLFLFTGLHSWGQIEWFEPRLKLGSAPNTAIVTLVGKTEAGSTITVNPNSINVIQYANKENSSFAPKIYNKPVYPDAKGFFYYPLLVPFGLTQLTVELTLANQAPKPMLITMRVDKDSANLNVKVTRAPKIIKVKERSQKIYEILFAIAPFFQSEKNTPEKNSTYSYSSNSLLTPSIDLRAKLNYWHLNMQTGLSDMKMASTIADKATPTTNFNYQWIKLGGNYRWRETSSFWLASEISWQKKSIFFLNKTSDPKFSILNIYRFGIGMEHLYNQNSYNIESDIKYHVPFAVKIDKGEIVYNPEYILTASTKCIFKRPGHWDWGVGLGLEANNFNIQYKSSIDSVDTVEQRSQLFYNLDFFMLYHWDKTSN